MYGRDEGEEAFDRPSWTQALAFRPGLVHPDRGAAQRRSLAVTLGHQFVQRSRIHAEAAASHREPVPDLSAWPVFGPEGAQAATAAKLERMRANRKALQQACLFVQAVAALNGYPRDAALSFLRVAGPFTQSRATLLRFLVALADMCRPSPGEPA
jgi:hypothetical protein